MPFSKYKQATKKSRPVYSAGFTLSLRLNGQSSKREGSDSILLVLLVYVCVCKHIHFFVTNYAEANFIKVSPLCFIQSNAPLKKTDKSLS
jgi:hypothetical protein